MTNRGLGRGLDALIPDTSALSAQEGEIILSLPIELIQPNPSQPRREFGEEELAALTQSIRQQGLLQPVVVRQVGLDRYQLIAGERRLRAADRAGFERVPAIVRVTSDEEMLPLALIENLLREDLNPIEEAVAFRALADQEEWTQDDIADRIGKSRAHVANTLRLLRLPTEIQEDVGSGRISRGHARALLAAEDEETMYELRERILAEGLTVREAEDQVSPPRGRVGDPRSPHRKRRTTVRDVSPETRDLEERLQRAFGTLVRIHERRGRGRITFEVYSYEDLARLTDQLLLAEGRTSPGRP